jgi:hypothetical protein
MKKYQALFLLLLLASAATARADSQWLLTASTLTYHVTHPLHEIAGISHEARGKGVCQQGQCNFLIAVPVKSFESGDTNRDLHMLQVTRGAEYPMVVVRTQLPESALGSPDIRVDLQVEFAGQTATFNNVPFHLTTEGQDVRISGTIPATVSAFKITPPELLFVPIRNEIPIDVRMTWQRQ